MQAHRAIRLIFPAIALATASAADVTLTASDALGSSSFHTAGGWDSLAAPSAGNDYFTGDFRLRTPADNASHTFAGDSLVVNDSAADATTGFTYKGTGTSGTITVENLILDGGQLIHLNGAGDLWQLDGAITVAANSRIWALQGPITLLAPLSGTAGITVPVSGSAACIVKLAAPDNTFTGNLVNNGRFELAAGANFRFAIGAPGVNNSISGNGAATHFNGVFQIDTSGSSAQVGSTWTLVSAANTTYGASFSVEGYSPEGTAGSRVWTSPAGTHAFDEATGTLTFLSVRSLAPYTANAHTVHLFHLDESAGASTAANVGTAGFHGLSVDGNPLTNGLTTNVSHILGAAGATGFGNAADLSAADLGIGIDASGDGSFAMDGASPSDAISTGSFMGPDNSFTLEALVNLPALTGANRQIWSTEANGTRGFQFRINSAGAIEFNFISTAAAGFSVPIPTSGPEAFVANEWFHVALTHTAAGGTPETKIYWTRLDPSRGEATLLWTDTTETVSPSVDAPLVLGNEARNISAGSNMAEGLLGRIDEARISNIVRTPGGFLFFDATTDSDGDGLPDYWETATNLDPNDDGSTGETSEGAKDGPHGAAGDPDEDGYSNADEFAAGSNPTDAASTPDDLDGDGLADSWEIATFGTTAYGPGDDPDNDGESTAVELANASAPNNPASDSSDTDADGLADSTELSHFGNLEQNAGDDPDGDRFSNIQEIQAGTDPTLAASRPAGTAVTLVPVDDGDNATSEFGYAGDSAINSVAFARSQLLTFGNQQFLAWYGRHQLDGSYLYNNTIWIARRTLGSTVWDVYRHPDFTANAITDNHDVVTFGIDGLGHMHLSWGMHGDAFHYSRSTGPVTGDNPIAFGPDITMTGNENAITYPQFLRLPDGDLLYLFREGLSGDGDTFLNRYDTGTMTWSNVHTSGVGTVQEPFIRASDWSPDQNAYPNMPQLGGDGDDLILTWNFREYFNYQSNHDFHFARSDDAGVTWKRYDGSPYTLPITPGSAERIVPIPQNSSLINQAGMCLDSDDNPVIASWWAPGAPNGNHQRQYMVVFRDTASGTWQTRQVSNRTIDNPATLTGDNTVRDLGRPVVITDDEDRIIVAYRDNQDANGLTLVHSLPKAQDPDRQLWIELDLTTGNLGRYEPQIDHDLWDAERKLHFLYQASQGYGFTPAANTAARISILEWDAAAYFQHAFQPSIETIGGGSQVRIACPSEPSWSYRLSTSTGLDGWTPVETVAGTGAPLEFIRDILPGEPKRFWRIERAEGGF